MRVSGVVERVISITEGLSPYVSDIPFSVEQTAFVKQKANKSKILSFWVKLFLKNLKTCKAVVRSPPPAYQRFFTGQVPFLPSNYRFQSIEVIKSE